MRRELAARQREAAASERQAAAREREAAAREAAAAVREVAAAAREAEAAEALRAAAEGTATRGAQLGKVERRATHAEAALTTAHGSALAPSGAATRQAEGEGVEPRSDLAEEGAASAVEAMRSARAHASALAHDLAHALRQAEAARLQAEGAARMAGAARAERNEAVRAAEAVSVAVRAGRGEAMAALAEQQSARDLATSLRLEVERIAAALRSCAGENDSSGGGTAAAAGMAGSLGGGAGAALGGGWQLPPTRECAAPPAGLPALSSARPSPPVHQVFASAPPASAGCAPPQPAAVPPSGPCGAHAPSAGAGYHSAHAPSAGAGYLDGTTLGASAAPYLDPMLAHFQALQRVGTGGVADGGARARAAAAFAQSWSEALAAKRAAGEQAAAGGGSEFGAAREAWGSPAPRCAKMGGWAAAVSPSLASPSTAPRPCGGCGCGSAGTLPGGDPSALATRLEWQARIADALRELQPLAAAGGGASARASPH